MKFIACPFSNEKGSVAPVYTFDDVTRFAKPFNHKDGLCEAFSFGEMATCGHSTVLSVAFVVPENQFRRYVVMVGSRLINLRNPTVGDRRTARRTAFAAKWGGHKPEYFTGLPKREPFSSESLNIYVLPPDWRMELQFPERVYDLKRKLYETPNDDFVAELRETRVVPT